MRFLALLFLCFGFITPAMALSVSPLIMELDMAGGRSATSLQATNNTDRRAAIEITVERQIDENNSVPDDENLLVFPPQVILGPGQAQTFRLQWIGDPGGAREQVFYVTVRELPLDLEPVTVERDGVAAQLRVAFAFKTLVIVSPLQGVTQLAITGARTLMPDTGVPVVTVQFRNTGNKRAQLASYGLIMRHADGRVVALGTPGWRYPDGWGRRLVLAGRSRELAIPLPDSSWQGPVSVSLQPR